MRFVNREEEIRFLKLHFDTEPNSLLFLFGPKSSGKSTLLYKVVDELDKKKYVVNYLNLRELLIYNFDSFIDRFFPKTLYNKVKDIADGVTFNIGFFGINIDDEKLLKQNPFKIMGDKLRAARKRGKEPIIILDEIQLLKNIYINGERYLIDELFNLFISLTKVTHTSHIILCTSDSYFIDEIYNSAKLKKTSEFYLVDHFYETTVTQWLVSEHFTTDEINMVWQYLGGCPWEIQQLIEKRKNGMSVRDACLYFVNDECSKIRELQNKLIEEKTNTEFEKVINEIAGKGSYVRSKKENIKKINSLLKQMIAYDIWFYKPEEQRIIANSQSIWWAFKKLTDLTP
ncbi:MAG: AAA family ATPase [Bacteroidia bacterium]|nr:AAA family ATPase [Bacteroidia bacterium]